MISAATLIHRLLQERRTDSKEEIEKAAKETKRNPTEKERESGAYKHGECVVQGLTIKIENAKGSTRKGKDKDGAEWRVTMPAIYGYCTKVNGKTARRARDKDHLDIYLGDHPHAFMVYVVNQRKIDSDAFDEHKCFVAFRSKQEAIDTYDKAFTGGLGPKLRKSVISMTMHRFREWLLHGDIKHELKAG